MQDKNNNLVNKLYIQATTTKPSEITNPGLCVSGHEQTAALNIRFCPH